MIIFLSDRIGKLRMILYGFFISAVVVIPIFINVPLIIIVFMLLFGISFDILWGLLFPISSKLFKREANTFLTLLGMCMALANTFSHITEPFVNGWGGFLANVTVSSISILVAGLLLIKVTRKHVDELN